MDCHNCASNGNEFFCAAGNSVAFEDRQGCPDWSPIQETTVQGVMPDGSVKELSSDELYSIWVCGSTPATMIRLLNQESPRATWRDKAALSFSVCWIFSMLVGASLVLTGIGVGVACQKFEGCYKEAAPYQWHEEDDPEYFL